MAAGTLVITKGYAALTPLMEADIDAFRNGLLTLLNVDKLNADNFDSSIDLTSEYFYDSNILPADNTTIDFGTGDDASFGIDASKDLVFDTAVNTTEIQFWAGDTYYMEFFIDKLNLPGDIILAKGGANRTVLQCLSSYRRPVLEWAGSDAVSISCNSADSSETLLMFPGYFLAVAETTNTSSKYRQASITPNANGYGVADTGNVKGGRRVGVSLTTNSWYAVYAVGLRSGTQYDANALKFILVYDDTLPTAANDATLDGYYGAGNWVYMGLVRYGYGAAGSSSTIIKFVQSRQGWCQFYGNDGGSTRGGLTLAQSTANTDDTSAFYTLSTGMSGNVVPSIVSHIGINVSRNAVSDWYIKEPGGAIVWRFGWQTDDDTFAHGHGIELPYQAYTVHQVRKGTGAVDKRVCLHSFCDGYLAIRRGGHGV